MPKMRETFGLCNRVSKRFATLPATASECEGSRYLHGVLPEEQIAENVLKERKPQKDFTS
jgi:hypothetical protein